VKAARNAEAPETVPRSLTTSTSGNRGAGRLLHAPPRHAEAVRPRSGPTTGLPPGCDVGRCLPRLLPAWGPSRLGRLEGPGADARLVNDPSADPHRHASIGDGLDRRPTTLIGCIRDEWGRVSKWRSGVGISLSGRIHGPSRGGRPTSVGGVYLPFCHVTRFRRCKCRIVKRLRRRSHTAARAEVAT